MNRIVWIARAVALMILVVFAIVMTRLHASLREISSSRPAQIQSTKP